MMGHGFLRGRLERRRREREARAEAVRAAAIDLVHRLVEPLVRAGAASIRSVAPSLDEGTGMHVVPSAAGAAPIWLYPGSHLHSLCVGEDGNLHEVLVGDDDGWLAELEGCVLAVLEGRYVEQITKRGRRLTMTFEQPEQTNIVVEHFGGRYGDVGVRRYAPYA